MHIKWCKEHSNIVSYTCIIKVGCKLDFILGCCPINTFPVSIPYSM